MSLSVIILAAGRGKRMSSSMPKVLHPVLGRAMLHYVVDAVKGLRPDNIIIVVGNGADAVMGSIDDRGVRFVRQRKLLGTAHAVKTARKALPSDSGTLLILNGDCPLITSGMLKRSLRLHKSDKNALSLLSFIDESLSGYGRIVRDDNGRITDIIEDRHTTPEERKWLRELNGGVYIMEHDALGYLGRIRKNSSSGEYYLTDIVGILVGMGMKVEAYPFSLEEVMGINTREDLYRVTEIMRGRVISGWMKKGVTFIDPHSSIVHTTVRIGRDTIIYPDTYLEGKTSIGKGCVIYPGVRVHDSVIGNRVVIKDNTLIEESRVADGATIGPFAHLRPGCIIGRDVKIGNFVEVKKSTIEKGTKAQHLSYIGDSIVGRDVNIGAGTITCNYDGIRKHRTVIGDGVFIGSDSQIIAPVNIGKGAYVAAGSTITKDVPSDSLAISRVGQRNIKGWAKRKRRCAG